MTDTAEFHTALQQLASREWMQISPDIITTLLSTTTDFAQFHREVKIAKMRASTYCHKGDYYGALTGASQIAALVERKATIHAGEGSVSHIASLVLKDPSDSDPSSSPSDSDPSQR